MQKFFIVRTHSFISCLGGWSQTILHVEVLGWRGCTWSAVMRPVGRTAIFSKMMLRRLMVEKLTLNSLATGLVDILARTLKTLDICGIVLCDKI